MIKEWKLQDAKAKFSRLVDDAMKVGPQLVTRHGKKAVVVISAGAAPEDKPNSMAAVAMATSK